MEQKYKNEKIYRFNQSTCSEYHNTILSDKIKKGKETQLNNPDIIKSCQINIKDLYHLSKLREIDLDNEIDNFNLLNGKSRKYSKDSEGLSTSSEDNKIKEEKININKNEWSKKEKFKCNALDFKQNYKTELCKYYEMKGYCKYGNKCAYAHGIENLRLKVTKTSAYRTKKCKKFFENGYCPYGNRCQFAHELKTNIINNPFDEKMSYTKILDIFSKREYIKTVKNMVQKPRLKVFKDIVGNNKENIRSRLLNDIKEITFNEIFY